jgi:carbon monoxide dehydrogenase subunit G
VKYEQPASRFAMVGVAVTRTTRHDNSPVRVAITGLGNGVTRWPEAEAALQAHWSVQALNGVHLSAELAHTDVHASASYRAHLSAVLCRRAVAAHTGEDTHLPRTTHGTRSPHARPTGTVAPGLSIHGSHELTQAVPLVWDALLDPVVLQQCIPGCESIQRLSDTLYTAVVKVGLGPVSARFETQIRVMPVRTPSQGDPAVCHLHLSGQAGSLGQGEAEVVVQLRAHATGTSPDAQGTHLQWQATPKVSGQLAQLGNRLMQASARSLSTQFFERLARVLSGQDASPAKFGFFSAVAEFFRHWHQLIFRK